MRAPTDPLSTTLPSEQTLLQDLNDQYKLYSTHPHPDIARTLNNLGKTLQAQGNYPKAKEYFNQALAMNQAIYVFNSDHPNIAETLVHLGIMYQAQNDTNNAQKYFIQALMMYRIHYIQNPNRPEIAEILYKISLTYQTQHNYAQAITALQQALLIYQTINAPNMVCLDIARIFHHLGDLELARENKTPARTYLNQALAMYQKIHHSIPNHPDIIATQASIDRGRCCTFSSILVALDCCGIFKPSQNNRTQHDAINPLIEPLAQKHIDALLS